MKTLKKLCCIILCFALLSSCILSLPVSAQTTTKRGFINSQNVCVRSDATTSSQVLDMLSHVSVTINSSTVGQEVFSGNNIWYHITYNGLSGYVYSKYVSPIMDITYDDDFETNLSNFPESYHSYLRELHTKYPNWKFVAHNLPMTFNEAVEKQYNVSSVEETMKWVEFSYGIEWRDNRAYDASTNTWKTLESRWTYASRAAIEYFMDPRNSLNENNVFVFMQQSFDSATQTKDTLRSVVENSFLAYGYDENYDGIIETDAYLDDIMLAAEQSGVSPFVLAATILVEQGAQGNTNMTSGTYPGFEGYYNFFNYNAYGSSIDAITAAALNYAVSQGWNSREAAIIGGATKYSNGYINVGQDTYYYKDFNVINQIYHHQYATSLYDAWTNASYLQKGCVLNTSASLVFEIPVYTDMPVRACIKPLPDGWQIVGANWYYYSSGSTISGWLYNNCWYYLNPNNYNIMATGWAYINNSWYFFADNGQMLTGWQQISDDWFFFAPTGEMLTGWQQLEGVWYYFSSNGAMHSGWKQQNDDWYFCASNGAMLTGWQQISGVWYFFAPSGEMLTGWQKLEGVWYYFDSNGAMCTGWNKQYDNWYFLASNGAMLSGWQQLDDVWHFFLSSGEMVTGWQKLEGVWYYFDSNGAMCTNWQYQYGYWYYFDSNGAMCTGWQQVGNYWYYFTPSGEMVTSWQQIDGVWYDFGYDGSLALDAYVV